MQNGKPKRILVLEDRDEMRKFIVSALTAEGYDVHVPVDSFVALSLARQQPFDLVTVDLVMPLVDGATFLRALRDMDIHIPAVVITGYSTDPRIELIRQMGVRHILTKPFRLEDLFKAIREILREDDPDRRDAPEPAPTPAET